MKSQQRSSEVNVKARLVKVTIEVNYDYKRGFTAKAKTAQLNVNDWAAYCTGDIQLVNDKCEFTVTPNMNVIHLDGPGFCYRYPKDGVIPGGISTDTVWIFNFTDHGTGPAEVTVTKKA